MDKVILDSLGAFVSKAFTALEKASGKKVGGPPRPMKFPYTFSAKIAQFPWRFYIDNSRVYRYYLISIVLCLPIFYKIERLCKW